MLAITENWLWEVQKKLQILVDKADDLKNRTRWDNIRVLSSKEAIKGEQPVAFFKHWLPKISNVDTKRSFI